MRLPLVAAIALLISTPSAFASGGLWCALEVGPVKLSVEAGLSRGAGSGIFGLKGKMDAEVPGLAADMAHVTYGQGNLSQWWIDGESLNLELYYEIDRASVIASSTLTIKTTTVEEGVYAGTYQLTAYDGADPIETKGEITCMAE
jgi:hypothetical protein